MAYVKKKRKISIIMGIYNCADTLREALDSILAQTYTDWEMIMCDDCSTDNTMEVAQEYVDRYDNFLLINNKNNSRLAATLNHCLEYAESDYIARMDGDDISIPERFAVQVSFLDAHPEYALVSCSMINFDKDGDWGVQTKPEKPCIRDFIYTSPFCHAPVMMRRKILNEVGNYTVKKELRRGQDFYLWHKFYHMGYKGYNLQTPYYKMRDDKNAAKRRTFKDDLYGTKIHLEVMSNLNIPLYKRIRAFKGIFIGLLPTSLRAWAHKKKLQNKK